MVIIISITLIAVTVVAVFMMPSDSASAPNTTETTVGIVTGEPEIIHPEVTGTNHGDHVTVNYTFDSLSDTYVNNDTILISSTVYFPIISYDDFEIQTAVSEDLMRFAEGEVQINEFEKGDAYDKYLYGLTSPEGFIPFEFVLSCESVYTKGSYLSVVFREVHTVGLNNPSERLICINYDMRTGNRISLSLVLSSDDSYAVDYVCDVFCSVINARPNAFYNDALDNLRNVVDIYNFYLCEDGVTLYFNPDVISHSINGVIEYTVPNDDIGF